MEKYECDVCGHVHEADENWKKVDDGWKCPTCESDKSYFKPMKGSAESTAQKGKFKYECDVCGHVQEGEESWKEIDDGWKCPTCESDKTYFKKMGTAAQLKAQETSGSDQDIQSPRE